MDLPDNHSRYYSSAIANAKKIISLGIWSVRMDAFNGWLTQFVSHEERFFAACLLNSLLYRSKLQFDSSVKCLYRGGVNRHLYPNEDDLFLQRELFSRKSKTALVPIIRDNDPPTKSGPLILRRLKKVLGVNDKNMIWPWQVRERKADFENVIFVDDFLGTGTQFCDFYKMWSLDESRDDLNYVYAPVVSHVKGIDYVNDQIPCVRVISSEILTEESGFFSDSFWLKVSSNKISGSDAEKWYVNFCKKNKIAKESFYRGFGDLSLTLSFEHGTPNNSLSCIWFSKSSWKPLLER